MNRNSIAISGLALLAGIGMSGTATAVDVNRDYLSHGVASCQGALPVFENNLRKRPLAMANEGSSVAFVTCDTDSINNNGTGSSQVGIYVINRAGAAGAVVNCQLVDGVYNTTFVPNIQKSSGPLAVGATGFMIWDAAADNNGANFIAPATSCGLPPGVDISLFGQVYPEDVGA